MQRLEEETNGFETTFKLTVSQTRADALRRHLESLLELMKKGEEDSTELGMSGEIIPGSALKRLRLQKKMTQRALAEALGTTQVRVSDMEQGIRPIPVDLAQKFAKLFGVPIELFFSWNSKSK